MLGPGKTSHDNRLVTCAAHERHHDTVFRDRVGMLYAALPLSQGILAIVAFVLFQFHATQTPAGQSWGWLALICCILGLRGLSAWLYRYRHRLLADERAWLLTYRVTAVAAGGVWGLSWQGDYIYVGATSNGVYVVDARDPANASHVSTLPVSGLGGVWAGPLFALGDLLVVTTPKNRAEPLADASTSGSMPAHS